MNGLFGGALPAGIPTIASGAATLVGSGAVSGVAWAQEVPARGPADGPWQMMHDWGMGWGWGGMFLGPLFMVVWLAVLVALIVLLVRWLGGGSLGTGTTPRTAREILDERYARGEIDHDEYEKRRKTLGN